MSPKVFTAYLRFRTVGFRSLSYWTRFLAFCWSGWGLLSADQLSVQVQKAPSVTLTDGTVGDNYRVQFTTNLTALTPWRTFTNLALSASSNTWVDLTADLHTPRFYRAQPTPLQQYNPPTSSPSTPPILGINDVLGNYQRLPVQNAWHRGAIIRKPGSATQLLWTNQAGVKWNLTPDFPHQLLLTDQTNPYQNSANGQNFTLNPLGDLLTGFYFNGEFFSKTDAQVPTITSDRLHGYISTSFVLPISPSYDFGFSFYTAVWPLLERPLADFQVGLPGTWLIPDNTDFNQPLLAPDNPTRINNPGQASSDWRYLFQTIEGSAGSWVSTQFPSMVPKYRMNGTIDGYLHEVSSPGWGFGQTSPLPTNALGLAQLSNRLLVPPDGLTFQGLPGGEFLGYAWMALPLIPPTDKVGDQSWTCFINAANYKGPIAFYIPELWTQYSKVYTNIVGRGLDRRPGLVNPLAMEFGAVPMKSQTNGAGNVYARIPRLLFPTNGLNATYLATDMTVYSKSALFNPVQSWFSGGNPVTARFDSSGSLPAPVSANVLGFSGGPNNLNVTGFGNTVATAILTTPGGGTALGLKWTGTGPAGVFPEYFVLKNNVYTPISSNQLPSDVVLPHLDFGPLGSGGPYTASAAWNSPAPSSPTNVVTLSDGSKVSYAWYRFVDQPAVQPFLWSPALRQQIQSRIESLHSHWSTTDNFMKPPTGGILATLDPGLMVVPPAGLEVGFVPIVLKQWKP